ncbi:unnamed protein product (macronuclear) [Paramecium tetraurelia]|uniref:Cyclin N-terminal domain-containing protein n=1 Tax=Paramecium tetraurelia TaxID=5888 RepID=A0DK45_PARTE|nr:uncharacterized protein GSPATT00017741001 [Paramecium tetraurelia]CAK83412.1 unnamed protein product [Paramecium tetraurelia]|eukprot:XP_001450809.1 hypothetical protein (macronuclear) [Paramecium tetraurelia strain d4-2]
MDAMSCNVCGNRLVIKGISLVCTGCGNATRSNHIFSTEQEYQKQILKRTTSHIMQRREREIQLNLTLSEHIKQNWIQYLAAFTKFINFIGKQLNLDIKPLFSRYLHHHINQPVNSNWTIARKGHQAFSENRVVNSKYKFNNSNTESTLNIKVEDDFDHDFEKQLQNNFTQDQQNQSSIIEIQQIKKKISKPKTPFYQKRVIKLQLKQGSNLGQTLSKRKQSVHRKGSQILDIPVNQDKSTFINGLLSSTNLTNTIYYALIEIYFEKYYSTTTNDLNLAIKKIKNIKTNSNNTQILSLKSISQELLQEMSPFLQKEYVLVQDILIYMLGCPNSFYEMSEQWNHFDFKTLNKNLKKRNVNFISRKIKYIQQFLKSCQQKEINTQETDVTVNINNKLFSKKKLNLIPLDFTFGLILIYATNLIQGNKLFPSKLIQLIKQKEINYLEGFSHLMGDTTNQYLTIPQHLPKSGFIRHQAVKLLKQFNIEYQESNREQFLDMFKSICIELKISQQIYSIALTFEQKYFINFNIHNSQHDIYSCSLILLAFKYYIYIDKLSAIKDLSLVFEYCKNIQPYDYKDLEDCTLENLRQKLNALQNFDQYYGDRDLNIKLNSKLQQLDSYFEQQIIQEYHKQVQTVEITNEVKINIIHEDWDFYKTGDFEFEAPEVRFLEMKLSNYIDDDENSIINLFHELERVLV